MEVGKRRFCPHAFPTCDLWSVLLGANSRLFGWMSSALGLVTGIVRAPMKLQPFRVSCFQMVSLVCAAAAPLRAGPRLFGRVGDPWTFSMRQEGFESDACGAASVRVPADLKPNSDVCCGGCSRRLATWSEYRATIALMLRDRGRPIADPLPR